MAARATRDDAALINDRPCDFSKAGPAPTQQLSIKKVRMTQLNGSSRATIIKWQALRRRWWGEVISCSIHRQQRIDTLGHQYGFYSTKLSRRKKKIILTRDNKVSQWLLFENGRFEVTNETVERTVGNPLVDRCIKVGLTSKLLAFEPDRLIILYPVFGRTLLSTSGIVYYTMHENVADKRTTNHANIAETAAVNFD